MSTAPKYNGMPGLIRKYYFVTPDGSEAGGIYLWQSREDADRQYSDEWKAFVFDKYGSAPVLTYLETPVVVDNLLNEIVSDGSGSTKILKKENHNNEQPCNQENSAGG